MKKYWTTFKYKRYNQKRAEASLRARIRGDSIRKISNFNKNRKPKRYEFVEAPENFSLIGNPEEVIEFIRTIRKHFHSRQMVWIVLKNVRRIDYDAIVVLLSALVRFKAEGIRFNGDYPEDPRSRQILEESGFFKNLFKAFTESDEYTIPAGAANFISTHGARIVEPELSAELVETASQKVWGERRRCMGVQTTLLELMQNTFAHAEPQKEGGRHWWLSINHAKGENKLRFSFVDYGVGIFKSLARKVPGNKWYGALERMYERFKYGNNAELMRLILSGELHRTVTGEYYRGQGLPGMLDSLNENWFTNLHVISNNVYADVSRGEYVPLGIDFPGTFVYWEVIPTNQNFDAGQ
jgi:hypothetical protein